MSMSRIPRLDPVQVEIPANSDYFNLFFDVNDDKLKVKTYNETTEDVQINGASGGGSGSVGIGSEVSNADDNSILYTDSQGNLAQDDLFTRDSDTKSTSIMHTFDSPQSLFNIEYGRVLITGNYVGSPVQAGETIHGVTSNAEAFVTRSIFADTHILVLTNINGNFINGETVTSQTANGQVFAYFADPEEFQPGDPVYCLDITQQGNDSLLGTGQVISIGEGHIVITAPTDVLDPEKNLFFDNPNPTKIFGIVSYVAQIENTPIISGVIMGTDIAAIGAKGTVIYQQVDEAIGLNGIIDDQQGLGTNLSAIMGALKFDTQQFVNIIANLGGTFINVQRGNSGTSASFLPTGFSISSNDQNDHVSGGLGFVDGRVVWTQSGYVFQLPRDLPDDSDQILGIENINDNTVELRWVDQTSGEGNGQESFISGSYSEVRSLRDNKLLIPGATYEITDGGQDNVPITLLATSIDTFELEGNGVFPVCDFQNSGNYSLLSTIPKTVINFSGMGNNDIIVKGIPYNNSVTTTVTMANTNVRNMSYQILAGSDTIFPGDVIVGEGDGQSATVISISFGTDTLTLQDVFGNDISIENTFTVAGKDLRISKNYILSPCDYYTWTDSLGASGNNITANGIQTANGNNNMQIGFNLTLGHNQGDTWNISFQSYDNPPQNVGIWKPDMEKILFTPNYLPTYRLENLSDNEDIYNGTFAHTENSTGIILSSTPTYIEYAVLTGDVGNNFMITVNSTNVTKSWSGSTYISGIYQMNNGERLDGNNGSYATISGYDQTGRYELTNVVGDFQSAQYYFNNMNPQLVVRNYGYTDRIQPSNVVIWNNSHYYVIDNYSFLTGATPDISQSYMLLSKASAPYGNGYKRESQIIIYDFETDIVKWRIDIRGNKIPANSHDYFQWGDNNLKNIVVSNYDCGVYTLNNRGYISGEVNGNTIVYMNDNTGTIYFHVSSLDAYINMSGNNGIVSLHLEGYNSGFDCQNQSGEIKVYIYESSVLEANQNTGTIRARINDGCYIDCNQNAGYIDKCQFSNHFRGRLKLNNGQSHTDNTYAISNYYIEFEQDKSFDKRVINNTCSTFETVVTVTDNVLQIPSNYYGKIYVRSDNFGETLHIDTINGAINFETDVPIPFDVMPAYGNTVELLSSDPYAVSQGSILLEGGLDITCGARTDPKLSDYITFIATYSGVNRQIGGSVI